MISIAIEDSGPGIPPEHRRSVTQAFVRLGASLSQPQDGRGGTRPRHREKVADSHGGSLAIGDAEPRGARILVSLPLYEANGALPNGMPTAAEVI